MSDQDYETLVQSHVAHIRNAFPIGYKDDNWTGLIIEGHEEGECPTCDAYRVLQRQEEGEEPHDFSGV